MPTLIREAGYRVMMYFNDHNPPHVHVFSAEKEARVTLDPIELKTNLGFNTHEVRDILDIIERHQAELLAAWRRIHPEA
jgi:hypothetical protein